jgi:hypothetical protein
VAAEGGFRTVEILRRLSSESGHPVDVANEGPGHLLASKTDVYDVVALVWSPPRPGCTGTGRRPIRVVTIALRFMLVSRRERRPARAFM